MKTASKKILIAEDEPQLRAMLVAAFDRAGCATSGAGDGEEALSIAKKEHPDIILLDILMPKMDGIEMLRALRTDEWGKNALVIFLTNLRGTERVAEGASLGVHDYFVKSDWKLEDIVKRVKEKMGV